MGFRFVQPTLHHRHDGVGRESDLCRHLSVHHRGDDPRHVEVLPVNVRPPKVPIGIFTLKNRTIGPVARLFVEYAREVASVTGSSRKSIIRPPTLAHRLRSDSRHLAGRVDRRPYAEVGNTLLKELDRLGSKGPARWGKRRV